MKPLNPPIFNHEILSKQFYLHEPNGHYALTFERGLNIRPTLTNNEIMYYTSDRSGSQDIWMRDLKTTVDIPLIRHDAKQHSPTVTD
ncbi:MAG: DUF192 domain-containing protein, partial [Spirochaetia bacterium]|nr:DUF192 domain-containing protein [Spirochaetia bacterium]